VLGTDTGGSVRIPASYCGIVGVKPSYGLVSTRGVVPLSHGLDHAGPLARSVADAAIMLEVLGGFDTACPQSRRGPAIRQDPIRPTRLDGVRIGVVSNFAAERTEAVVIDSFNAALDQLSRLGATVRSVELPTYDVVRGRRAGFARVEAEAAFVHGPLHEKEPWRLSPEMRTCLDYGARMSATRLLEVNRRIDVAAWELDRCLEEVDAIVSPTTPQAAPLFGGPPNDNAGTFCILANFAGTPAISVPMGCDETGLPLGLQIIGALHRDAQVLEIAASYEAAAGLDIRPPPPYDGQV
jgi:Asp-tRNA(Asn)/Glu-tRNA(Gln) amidotransferase A subunit family amidase